ncbi:MAG: DUF2891 domain-containing protein [Saprospiraceae bacterium]|nr:DUF2891 domain-containing protein [Saprospiraceae bacterium]
MLLLSNKIIKPQIIYLPDKCSIFLTICLTFFISACDVRDSGKVDQTPLTITKEMAENLSLLPLKCIQKEFPNKLNQSLGDSSEMGTPKELHPAYYGCYDWHSSVHGHWMLVKLLKLYPDLKHENDIRNKLRENISKTNIQIEVNYFLRKSEKSYERTYGWAWLLKLHEELYTWDDSMAVTLLSNLKPLTDLIVNRYTEFLPKLNYPIRSGEHPNTCFGLALAYDYAKTVKNDTFTRLIVNRSRYFFLNDINCPVSWEPGGFDFLSPCLQEADLMARILDGEEFKKWLDKFLPEINKHNYVLAKADVSDRTDGKLVHLDGVNFCRAWSLYSISKTIPEYGHLIKIANDHVNASLPQIIDGGYEGEHWLASFAVYALSHE